MKIMEWIHEVLGHRPHPPDRFSEAMNVTDEVAGKTRELRAQIEPYARMKDPFIALWTNRYEVEQERHMHEGPPR